MYGIGKGAGDDDAASGGRPNPDRRQIAAENVVTGVAAVVIHIRPGFAELQPRIAGLGGAAAHREGAERGQGRARRSLLDQVGGIDWS